MTAALTNCHIVNMVDDFLLFGFQELDDQSRHGKEDPFDGEPPPTYKQPPRAAVMHIL